MFLAAEYDEHRPACETEIPKTETLGAARLSHRGSLSTVLSHIRDTVSLNAT